MATNSYQEALRQVQSLSLADQKRLLMEVTEQLETTPEPTTSILELQGLGKEIWRDLDVEEYLNRERASWDG